MELLRLPIAAMAEEISSLFPASAEAEGSEAWFSTLASQTLAPGEEAFVAALRGRGEFVAAIPLVQTPGRAIRALTSPYSTSFGPAAISSADACALGASLGQLVTRRLDLDSMDMETKQNQDFFKGLTRSGLVTTSYRHFANWYEDIACFDAFWAARPTRLRETVKRKEHKLRQAGADFLIHSDCRDIGYAIADYRDVYADSGKVAEPHPDFISKMIERLAARGDVRLGQVRLNGEVVAVQLWLVHDHHATIFKLAHRARSSSWSPGTVLTYWMFKHLAPPLGRIRIDFGRGDDSYKKDWLRFRTFRRGIIACNPTNLTGLRDIATMIFPTRAGQTWRREAGPF